MNIWPGLSPRFIPLRYRFIATTSGLLIFLLGVTAFILGRFESLAIRRDLEHRGLAVAQSLAATSRTNLITYNHVALEQAANQAVDGHAIVSVIIHDKEGRVAGVSGRPDLQNSVLADSWSREALKTSEALVQESIPPNSRERVLEVVFPVFLSGSSTKWGTVRVGMSLLPMVRQVRLIHGTIAVIGVLALVLGILVSAWAARRITRPLNDLVAATVRAAGGDLNQRIAIATRDEVEVLAANFSDMIREILSHRRQLEQRLAEISRLQAYREQVLVTMADGLMSVDMEGGVTTCNPAAREILGLGGDQGGLHLFAPPASLPSVFTDLLRRVLQHGVLETPERSRELLVHIGDEERALLLTMSFLRGSNHAPRELIVNLHDITELKRLEGRIRQSERLAALGTLAAGMAHEIRNPLSAIKTFVQLLPRKMEKPQFMERFQHTVPREIERINRLVGELLDLARPPSYLFQSTDVVLLLKQTVELLEAEMSAHGVVLSLVAPENVPPVQADGQQLVKVFLNLLRNADQAMPNGGTVEVAVRLIPEMVEEKEMGPCVENRWVEILIEDSGAGISPEHLDQVFNPFFTTKEHGTGLGLSISHKIVTEHHGELIITSRLGKGTRVTVRLPCPA